MKKQAILIQCHNKPEQINFLIEVMPADKFDFYIHVDKKSVIFNEIKRNDNIFFSERIDVHWGRFSQVEATMKLFSMIDTSKYSYVHLISGNDFIVKHPDEIYTFFNDNDKEFIESNILPGTCTWSWNGLDRYSVYYPQWIIHRPADMFFRIIRVAYREFVMRTKIFTRKKFPVKDFYGGSSWFSITGSLVGWMKKYLEENPEYVEFFKHGVCVDEVFFQTLARCSPYSKNIINEHLRYMIWNGVTTGGPKTIMELDIIDIKESNCIWARKFTDIETIKKLYWEIVNTEFS